MDVGAITPALWGFEARERLMEFYERVSGARLHANYFRVGGVHQDMPENLAEDIGNYFEKEFPRVVNDIELLLTENRIFKQRNVDIGVITAEEGNSVGVHRSDAAGLGCAVGPSQGATLRGVWAHGLRRTGRQERRLLRPATSAGWRRCARARESSSNA